MNFEIDAKPDVIYVTAYTAHSGKSRVCFDRAALPELIDLLRDIKPIEKSEEEDPV